MNVHIRLQAIQEESETDTIPVLIGLFNALVHVTCCRRPIRRILDKNLHSLDGTRRHCFSGLISCKKGTGPSGTE